MLLLLLQPFKEEWRLGCSKIKQAWENAGHYPPLCTEDGAHKTGWQGTREGERKCPLDFSSYLSPHREYLEVIFLCFKGNKCNYFQARNWEFNKVRESLRLKAWFLELCQLPAASGKKKTAVDMRFPPLGNEWATPGCSGLSPHGFILTSQLYKEFWGSQVIPNKNL